MERTELARRIVEVAHRTGDFRLRSGQTSNHYFDKYRFESSPELLREIAHHMVALLPEDTQVLAGLELGGVPLATALSLETGLPTAFVRKERKTYGTCQIAEGAELAGKRVCIIEDVITTGGAVLDSVSELRQSGAQLDTVLCVIFRGNPQDDRVAQAGLQRTALFGMEDLAPYMP